MKKIALDIDGTITADPEFFSELAKEVLNGGGEIHIVSSRAPQSYQETESELRGYGLTWTALYLLPSISESQSSCPHGSLDWYEKYLWQKVDYALRLGLNAFVDDDQKVLSLLARFAPNVAPLHPDERHRIHDAAGL